MGFNPTFVIISAGFDAVRGDPLGGYEVSPEEGYPGMLQRILSVCERDVRTLLILEGGYNLNMIAKCTVSCLAFLEQYYKQNEENDDSGKTIEKFCNINEEELKEFALYNFEEVLKNIIPVWDNIVHGSLSKKLEVIQNEIKNRKEQRESISPTKVPLPLRRSPRKKVPRKSSDEEKSEESSSHDFNSPDIIKDLSQSFSQ